MTRFRIDNEAVDWRVIGVHLRKNVPDETPKLILEVGLDESAIVSELERMIGLGHQEEGFAEKALSHTNSTFNPVSYVLWQMESEHGKSAQTFQWIVTSVLRIEVTADKLIMFASVSPFAQPTPDLQRSPTPLG